MLRLLRRGVLLLFLLRLQGLLVRFVPPPLLNQKLRRSLFTRARAGGSRLARVPQLQSGSLVVTARPCGTLHHDRRPSPGFPHSSSSSHTFPSSLDSTVRGGSSHYPFVSSFAPRKEDYQGAFCRPAPVFLQGLCGNEEGWPVPHDHRSVQVERASGDPYISNGICAENRTGHCRGTLGLHNRSQRCLFSCSDGLGFSPLPSVLSGWESFSFPIPSFRSLSGSVGLSQDYQTCDGLPPQEIRPNTFLSG